MILPQDISIEEAECLIAHLEALIIRLEREKEERLWCCF
jgi:hypothetical protein